MSQTLRWAGCLAVMLWAAIGLAQPSAKRVEGKAPPTTISFELLVGNEGVGVQAQKWVAIFQKLDIPLSIKQGSFDSKTGITETRSRTGLRDVQIVAYMDRSGRITLPGKSFTIAEATKLADWLKEVSKYGAQGMPEGPAWGLSPEQFADLFKELGAPVAIDSREQPFGEVLKSLKLPPKYPLEIAEEVRGVIRDRDQTPVRQQINQVALGTALAALLHEQKLAFRPVRLPSGTVTLRIVPFVAETDIWPIGWPLGDKTGTQVAPRLYKLNTVDLNPIELEAVLDTVASLSEIPILIDYAGLADRKIDITTLKVSHPKKQTTYGLAVKALVFQAHCKADVLLDESGRAIVWVSSLGGLPKKPR